MSSRITAPSRRRRSTLRRAIEPLESRQLLSVSGDTLVGTTAPGATLVYQVNEAGVSAAVNRTVTVVGPATFNGQAVTQVDDTRSVTASTTLSSVTTSTYSTATDAGWVTEGASTTSTDDHTFTTTATTDTYSPAIVAYPTTMDAGTPYTTNWSDTQVQTVTGPGEPGTPTTTTTTGTHTVTLASETPEAVDVPAGRFDAYRLTTTDVTTTGDMATATEATIWVVPGVGVVKRVTGGDVPESQMLASATGVASVPTPATSMSVAVQRSTLPTQAVAGRAISGVVTVSVDNVGTSAVPGAKRVQVYATATGGIDDNSVLLGTAQRSVALAVGKPVTFAVKAKARSLPAGTFAIVAVVTDVPTASVGESNAATTVTAATAFTSLSASVGDVAPATVKAGKSGRFTVTLTNAGNTDATGKAEITVGLSDDGSTVTTLLEAVKRSVRVKANGSAKVTLTFKIAKTSLVSGTRYPAVTVTLAGQTITAVGPNPFTVGNPIAQPL